jgi:capsular polysaccharide export protein
LEGALRATGHSVRRVAFNAGDNLFSSRVHRPTRLSINLNEWESWLRFELSRRAFDCIILFGSSRPAHKIARQIAQQFNIKVLSLEEGYLRSGYVTAEFDGNNQHSSLTSWKPKNHQPIDAGSIPAPMALPSSFVAMSVWGAIYYLARDVFSTASDEYLFHRSSERVVPLAWSWCSHIARRGVARITEFPARRNLRRKPDYILVPLQVSSDSQMQLAARGWNIPKLVDACLNSLAQSNANQKVVFKLHPLERKNALITRLIHRKAKSLGLKLERFAVVNSGRIGELTLHSSGMVVINSTSGFSALHHNKPLLVLGDAVFRHEEIATTGNNEEDIRIFFQHRQAKASSLIKQFLDTLKSQCLVPGDFYITEGRKAAVRHVIEKLEQLPLSSVNLKEAEA